MYSLAISGVELVLCLDFGWKEKIKTQETREYNQKRLDEIY